MRPDTVKRSQRDEVERDEILHRVKEIEERQARVERKLDRVLDYLLEERNRE